MSSRARRGIAGATALIALAAGLTGPTAASAVPQTAASARTAAPASVTVEAGNARAWVSWSAPALPPASITGYAITPVADGVALPAQTILSTATKGYVTDVPNGRVTRFRVAALTGGVPGLASELSEPVVLPYGSLTATVQALYSKFAGRGPTSAELAAAVDRLAASDDVGALVQDLRRSTNGTNTDALTNVDPVTRLYFAYLLRIPDVGGLHYWLAKKRAGTNVAAISARFAASSEFTNRYGTLSNEAFVRLIYANVLGRPAEATGLAYWTGRLDAKAKNRGQVMVGFSESSEYKRKKAAAVDVAVIWGELTGRAPSQAVFDQWVTALGSSADPTATIGDLVEAALGTVATSGRWFCLPHEPQSAADVNALINHRDDRWRMADNARSVKLPDGRIVWIFADTLYGKVNADGSLPATGWGFTHGSALIQDGACIDPFYSATQPGPTSFIPNVSTTDFFWPQSGWVDASGSTLYVIAGERIGNPSTGGSDGGTVVARFSLPDLEFQGTTPIARPPKGKGMGWGQALRDGAWVYVYADSGPDPDTTWPFDHSAARFPATGTPSSNGTGWEYWTGSGWSGDISKLKPMTFPAGKLIFSNVIKTASGYALVGKPYGTTVVLGWKSAGPAGPWTELGTVADLSAVPTGRTYAVHAESTVPGVAPFVVWSQSPAASGSISGGGIGVRAPLVPLG